MIRTRTPPPAWVGLSSSDAKTADRLAEVLEGAGYALTRLGPPSRAVEALAHSPPSVALCHQSEIRPLASFCSRVRQEPGLRDMPLLGMGPSGNPKEIAEVLDAGADDFLARPFSPELLLARVRALLRRRQWSQGGPATELEAGSLRLALLERTASLSGRVLALTRLEFDLLAYLMARPGQALTRTEILQSVWKYPPDVETRTLDKHVESLRRKLGVLDGLIQTVRSVGFRFKFPG